MSDDLRNVFFVVKGQYKKGVRPSFVNSVSKEVNYIGGYDPYNKDTSEWYMVLDSKTYHCLACGCDLEKVLKSVYDTVIQYKGVAKKYFKQVCSITSDDYYETHYLGRPPFTPEQISKKAVGRCPRVSPVMKDLYDHIFEEYGDFFRDKVEEMVEKAYKDLKDTHPLSKAKNRVLKAKEKTQTNKTTENTKKVIAPQGEVRVETPKLTLKKVPKVKSKLKKL